MPVEQFFLGFIVGAVGRQCEMPGGNASVEEHRSDPPVLDGEAARTSSWAKEVGGLAVATPAMRVWAGLILALACSELLVTRGGRRLALWHWRLCAPVKPVRDPICARCTTMCQLKTANGGRKS